MYTPPFIPRADPAFRRFAESFANNISSDPPRYGLTVAQADWIMRHFNEFDAAYEIAKAPATRTRPTIADKDDARSILHNTISVYSAHLRANLGITDGDKLLIGVRPRNVAHKRRKCPGIPPLLNYIGSLPGIDQMVFHDSSTPTSKAKPYGAERLELWVGYSKPGEQRPKREDARLIGTFKKSKMLIDQDPQRDVRMGGSEGMPTYFARWLGHDGKTGPWSLPCWTTIASKPAQNAPKVKSDTDEGHAQPLKLAA